MLFTVISDEGERSSKSRPEYRRGFRICKGSRVAYTLNLL